MIHTVVLAVCLVFVAVLFVLPVKPDPPMKPGDTYSDDLRRWNPEVSRNADGIPDVCCAYYYAVKCPKRGTCADCWNRVIPHSEKK